MEMKVLILVVVALLLEACASPHVRCDGRLTPINVSAQQKGSRAQ
jgi:uncharacterized lipoprotein YmbA